eukprot:4175388-Pyramimonas_sp.AAC.1
MGLELLTQECRRLWGHLQDLLRRAPDTQPQVGNPDRKARARDVDWVQPCRALSVGRVGDEHPSEAEDRNLAA